MGGDGGSGGKSASAAVAAGPVGAILPSDKTSIRTLLEREYPMHFEWEQQSTLPSTLYYHPSIEVDFNLATAAATASPPTTATTQPRLPPFEPSTQVTQFEEHEADASLLMHGSQSSRVKKVQPQSVSILSRSTPFTASNPLYSELSMEIASIAHDDSLPYLEQLFRRAQAIPTAIRRMKATMKEGQHANEHRAKLVAKCLAEVMKAYVEEESDETTGTNSTFTQPDDHLARIQHVLNDAHSKKSQKVSELAATLSTILSSPAVPRSLPIMHKLGMKMMIQSGLIFLQTLQTYDPKVLVKILDLTKDVLLELPSPSSLSNTRGGLLQHGVHTASIHAFAPVFDYFAQVLSQIEPHQNKDAPVLTAAPSPFAALLGGSAPSSTSSRPPTMMKRIKNESSTQSQQQSPLTPQFIRSQCVEVSLLWSIARGNFYEVMQWIVYLLERDCIDSVKNTTIPSTRTGFPTYAIAPFQTFLGLYQFSHDACEEELRQFISDRAEASFAPLKQQAYLARMTALRASLAARRKLIGKKPHKKYQDRVQDKAKKRREYENNNGRRDSTRRSRYENNSDSSSDNGYESGSVSSSESSALSSESDENEDGSDAGGSDAGSEISDLAGDGDDEDEEDDEKSDDENDSEKEEEEEKKTETDTLNADSQATTQPLSQNTSDEHKIDDATSSSLGAPSTSATTTASADSSSLALTREDADDADYDSDLETSLDPRNSSIRSVKDVGISRMQFLHGVVFLSNLFDTAEDDAKIETAQNQLVQQTLKELEAKEQAKQQKKSTAADAVTPQEFHTQPMQMLKEFNLMPPLATSPSSTSVSSSQVSRVTTPTLLMFLLAHLDRLSSRLIDVLTPPSLKDDSSLTKNKKDEKHMNSRERRRAKKKAEKAKKKREKLLQAIQLGEIDPLVFCGREDAFQAMTQVIEFLEPVYLQGMESSAQKQFVMSDYLSYTYILLATVRLLGRHLYVLQLVCNLPVEHAHPIPRITAAAALKIRTLLWRLFQSNPVPAKQSELVQEQEKVRSTIRSAVQSILSECYEVLYTSDPPNATAVKVDEDDEETQQQVVQAPKSNKLYLLGDIMQMWQQEEEAQKKVALPSSSSSSSIPSSPSTSSIFPTFLRSFLSSSSPSFLLHTQSLVHSLLSFESSMSAPFEPYVTVLCKRVKERQRKKKKRSDDDYDYDEREEEREREEEERKQAESNGEISMDLEKVFKNPFELLEETSTSSVSGSTGVPLSHTEMLKEQQTKSLEVLKAVYGLIKRSAREMRTDISIASTSTSTSDVKIEEIPTNTSIGASSSTTSSILAATSNSSLSSPIPITLDLSQLEPTGSSIDLFNRRISSAPTDSSSSSTPSSAASRVPWFPSMIQFLSSFQGMLIYATMQTLKLHQRLAIEKETKMENERKIAAQKGFAATRSAPTTSSSSSVSASATEEKQTESKEQESKEQEFKESESSSLSSATPSSSATSSSVLAAQLRTHVQIAQQYVLDLLNLFLSESDDEEPLVSFNRVGDSWELSQFSFTLLHSIIEPLLLSLLHLNNLDAAPMIVALLPTLHRMFTHLHTVWTKTVGSDTAKQLEINLPPSQKNSVASATTWFSTILLPTFVHTLSSLARQTFFALAPLAEHPKEEEPFTIEEAENAYQQLEKYREAQRKKPKDETLTLIDTRIEEWTDQTALLRGGLNANALLPTSAALTPVAPYSLQQLQRLMKTNSANELDDPLSSEFQQRCAEYLPWINTAKPATSEEDTFLRMFFSHAPSYDWFFTHLATGTKVKPPRIQKSVASVAQKASQLYFCVMVRHLKCAHVCLKECRNYELTQKNSSASSTSAAPAQSKPSAKLVSLYVKSLELHNLFARCKGEGGDIDALYEQIRERASFLCFDVEVNDERRDTARIQAYAGAKRETNTLLRAATPMSPSVSVPASPYALHPTSLVATKGTAAADSLTLPPPPLTPLMVRTPSKWVKARALIRLLCHTLGATIRLKKRVQSSKHTSSSASVNLNALGSNITSLQYDSNPLLSASFKHLDEEVQIITSAYVFLIQNYDALVNKNQTPKNDDASSSSSLSKSFHNTSFLRLLKQRMIDQHTRSVWRMLGLVYFERLIEYLKGDVTTSSTTIESHAARLLPNTPSVVLNYSLLNDALLHLRPSSNGVSFISCSTVSPACIPVLITQFSTIFQSVLKASQQLRPSHPMYSQLQLQTLNLVNYLPANGTGSGLTLQSSSNTLLAPIATSRLVASSSSSDLSAQSNNNASFSEWSNWHSLGSYLEGLIHPPLLAQLSSPSSWLTSPNAFVANWELRFSAWTMFRLIAYRSSEVFAQLSCEAEAIALQRSEIQQKNNQVARYTTASTKATTAAPASNTTSPIANDHPSKQLTLNSLNFIYRELQTAQARRRELRIEMDTLIERMKSEPIDQVVDPALVPTGFLVCESCFHIESDTTVTECAACGHKKLILRPITASRVMYNGIAAYDPKAATTATKSTSDTKSKSAASSLQTSPSKLKSKSKNTSSKKSPKLKSSPAKRKLPRMSDSDAESNDDENGDDEEDEKEDDDNADDENDGDDDEHDDADEDDDEDSPKKSPVKRKSRKMRSGSENEDDEQDEDGEDEDGEENGEDDESGNESDHNENNYSIDLGTFSNSDATSEEEENDDDEDDDDDAATSSKSSRKYLSPSKVTTLLEGAPYELLQGRYNGRLTCPSLDSNLRVRLQFETIKLVDGRQEFTGVLSTFGSQIGSARIKGENNPLTGALDFQTTELLQGEVIVPAEYHARVKYEDGKQSITGSWNSTIDPETSGTIKAHLDSKTVARDPSSSAGKDKDAKTKKPTPSGRDTGLGSFLESRRLGESVTSWFNYEARVPHNPIEVLPPSASAGMPLQPRFTMVLKQYQLLTLYINQHLWVLLRIMHTHQVLIEKCLPNIAPILTEKDTITVPTSNSTVPRDWLGMFLQYLTEDVGQTDQSEVAKPASSTQSPLVHASMRPKKTFTNPVAWITRVLSFRLLRLVLPLSDPESIASSLQSACSFDMSGFFDFCLHLIGVDSLRPIETLFHALPACEDPQHSDPVRLKLLKKKKSWSDTEVSNYQVKVAQDREKRSHIAFLNRSQSIAEEAMNLMRSLMMEKCEMKKSSEDLDEGDDEDEADASTSQKSSPVNPHMKQWKRLLFEHALDHILRAASTIDELSALVGQTIVPADVKWEEMILPRVSTLSPRIVHLFGVLHVFGGGVAALREGSLVEVPQSLIDKKKSDSSSSESTDAGGAIEPLVAVVVAVKYEPFDENNDDNSSVSSMESDHEDDDLLDCTRIVTVQLTGDRAVGGDLYNVLARTITTRPEIDVPTLVASSPLAPSTASHDEFEQLARRFLDAFGSLLIMSPPPLLSAHPQCSLILLQLHRRLLQILPHFLTHKAHVDYWMHGMDRHHHGRSFATHIAQASLGVIEAPSDLKESIEPDPWEQSSSTTTIVRPSRAHWESYLASLDRWRPLVKFTPTSSSSGIISLQRNITPAEQKALNDELDKAGFGLGLFNFFGSDDDDKPKKVEEKKEVEEKEKEVEKKEEEDKKEQRSSDESDSKSSTRIASSLFAESNPTAATPSSLDLYAPAVSRSAAKAEVKKVDSTWKSLVGVREMRAYMKGRIHQPPHSTAAASSSTSTSTSTALPVPFLQQISHHVPLRMVGYRGETDNKCTELSPHKYAIHSTDYFATWVPEGLLLTSGRWYWVIEIQKGLIHQLGVATPDFRVRPTKGHTYYGAGDDDYSWIIDLSRLCRYHGADQPSQTYGHGIPWVQGDFVGFGLEFNESTGKATMRCWLNGVDLGVAYDDIPSSKGLFPAASVDGPGYVHFCMDPNDFGTCPLPAGYKPLAAPKLDPTKALVSYPTQAFVWDTNELLKEQKEKKKSFSGSASEEKKSDEESKESEISSKPLTVNNLVSSTHRGTFTLSSSRFTTTIPYPNSSYSLVGRSSSLTDSKHATGDAGIQIDPMEDGVTWSFPVNFAHTSNAAASADSDTLPASAVLAQLCELTTSSGKRVLTISRTSDGSEFEVSTMNEQGEALTKRATINESVLAHAPKLMKSTSTSKQVTFESSPKSKTAVVPTFTTSTSTERGGFGGFGTSSGFNFGADPVSASAPSFAPSSDSAGFAFMFAPTQQTTRVLPSSGVTHLSLSTPSLFAPLQQMLSAMDSTLSQQVSALEPPTIHVPSTPSGDATTEKKHEPTPPAKLVHEVYVVIQAAKEEKKEQVLVYVNNTLLCTLEGTDLLGEQQRSTSTSDAGAEAAPMKLTLQLPLVPGVASKSDSTSSSVLAATSTSTSVTETSTSESEEKKSEEKTSETSTKSKSTSSSSTDEDTHIPLTEIGVWSIPLSTVQLTHLHDGGLQHVFEDALTIRLQAEAVSIIDFTQSEDDKSSKATLPTGAKWSKPEHALTVVASSSGLPISTASSVYLDRPSHLSDPSTDSSPYTVMVDMKIKELPLGPRSKEKREITKEDVLAKATETALAMAKDAGTTSATTTTTPAATTATTTATAPAPVAAKSAFSLFDSDSSEDEDEYFGGLGDFGAIFEAAEAQAMPDWTPPTEVIKKLIVEEVENHVILFRTNPTSTSHLQRNAQVSLLSDGHLRLDGLADAPTSTLSIHADPSRIYRFAFVKTDQSFTVYVDGTQYVRFPEDEYTSSDMSDQWNLSQSEIEVGKIVERHDVTPEESSAIMESILNYFRATPLSKFLSESESGLKKQAEPAALLLTPDHLILMHDLCYGDSSWITKRLAYLQKTDTKFQSIDTMLERLWRMREQDKGKEDASLDEEDEKKEEKKEEEKKSSSSDESEKKAETEPVLSGTATPQEAKVDTESSPIKSPTSESTSVLSLKPSLPSSSSSINSTPTLELKCVSIFSYACVPSQLIAGTPCVNLSATSLPMSGLPTNYLGGAAAAVQAFGVNPFVLPKMRITPKVNPKVEPPKFKPRLLVKPPNPNNPHNHKLDTAYETNQHEHECVYQANAGYFSGSFGCDICGSMGDSFVYHCSECNWDCHPKCFIQRDAPKAQTNPHRHAFGDSFECDGLPGYEVEFVDSLASDPRYGGNTFGCNICGKTGTTPSYHCGKDGLTWDAHPGCVVVVNDGDSLIIPPPPAPSPNIFTFDSSYQSVLNLSLISRYAESHRSLYVHLASVEALSARAELLCKLHPAFNKIKISKILGHVLQELKLGDTSGVVDVAALAAETPAVIAQREKDTAKSMETLVSSLLSHLYDLISHTKLAAEHDSAISVDEFVAASLSKAHSTTFLSNFLKPFPLVDRTSSAWNSLTSEAITRDTGKRVHDAMCNPATGLTQSQTSLLRGVDEEIEWPKQEANDSAKGNAALKPLPVEFASHELFDVETYFTTRSTTERGLIALYARELVVHSLAVWNRADSQQPRRLNAHAASTPADDDELPSMSRSFSNSSNSSASSLTLPGITRSNSRSGGPPPMLQRSMSVQAAAGTSSFPFARFGSIGYLPQLMRVLDFENGAPLLGDASELASDSESRLSLHDDSRQMQRTIKNIVIGEMFELEQVIYSEVMSQLQRTGTASLSKVGTSTHHTPHPITFDRTVGPTPQLVHLFDRYAPVSSQLLREILSMLVSSLFYPSSLDATKSTAAASKPTPTVSTYSPRFILLILLLFHERINKLHDQEQRMRARSRDPDTDLVLRAKTLSVEGLTSLFFPPPLIHSLFSSTILQPVHNVTITYTRVLMKLIPYFHVSQEMFTFVYQAYKSVDSALITAAEVAKSSSKSAQATPPKLSHLQKVILDFYHVVMKKMILQIREKEKERKEKEAKEKKLLKEDVKEEEAKSTSESLKTVTTKEDAKDTASSATTDATAKADGKVATTSSSSSSSSTTLANVTIKLSSALSSLLTVIQVMRVLASDVSPAMLAASNTDSAASLAQNVPLQGFLDNFLTLVTSELGVVLTQGEDLHPTKSLKYWHSHFLKHTPLHASRTYTELAAYVNAHLQKYLSVSEHNSSALSGSVSFLRALSGEMKPPSSDSSSSSSSTASRSLIDRCTDFRLKFIAAKDDPKKVEELQEPLMGSLDSAFDSYPTLAKMGLHEFTMHAIILMQFNNIVNDIIYLFDLTAAPGAIGAIVHGSGAGGSGASGSGSTGGGGSNTNNNSSNSSPVYSTVHTSSCFDLLFSCKSFLFSHLKQTWLTDSCTRTTTYGGGTVHLDTFRAAKVQSNLIGFNNVRRSLFGQFFKQQYQRAHVNFRTSPNNRAFSVAYVGLHASDAGGPYREAIGDCMKELQSNKLPFFLPVANAKSGTGSNRDCWITRPYFVSPAPFATQPLTPQQQRTYMVRKQCYRFIGMLMGLAIRSKYLLPLNLPPLLWRLLAQEEITLKHVEEIDQLSCSLIHDFSNATSKKEKKNETAASGSGSGSTNEEKKESVADTSASSSSSSASSFAHPIATDSSSSSSSSAFTDDSIFDSVMSEMKMEVTGLDGVSYELIPNGHNIGITSANVKQYLSLLKQFRIHEFDAEIAEIRTGLMSVVPPAFVQLHTGDELRMLVVGTGTIDMELLERMTTVEHELKETPTIKWFWKVLKERFTPLQQSKFLTFTWGRSTLPTREVDFERKMNVQLLREGNDPDKNLPASHTCFFGIDIPMWTSEEIVYSKLLYAVENCTSIDGDGSIQTAGGDESDDDSQADEDEWGYSA